MRAIFTDNMNSLYHFVFGIAAVKFTIIVPLFILYQYIDIYEKNIRIDLLEFFVGFFIGFLIMYPNKLYPFKK